ncbi:MAG: cytochrome b N-terminal domain-containing protein, partial [Alphaproteobacteria bacterium]
TSVSDAYVSVEALTHEQWYLGGVMRSLHRYASDALVLVMGVHVLREFAYDRYRGARWFTWFTGVPILWLVVISGVTGYWLVWDKLAQYVAVATTEWLDSLPIFGAQIAGNFLTPESLDSRFFTLMVFLYIAVPLFLLLALWIHLQRVSQPKINPPRGLAVGIFLSMLALSLVKPALSQGPADLATIPATLDLDWFYLAVYPLLDVMSGASLWALVGIASLILAVLPWMPAMRRSAAAQVNLDNCNGCARCVDDCPFNAITLVPRTDGKPFDHEAAVDSKLCISCGICVGACPTSMPFRRAAPLVSGIELPDLTTAMLRHRLESAVAALQGDARIVVFGCDHGAPVRALAGPGTAAISLPCVAMLPPAFIDYALSRNRADGVIVASCRNGQCDARFGPRWMAARLAGTRDPYLRARVPRQRLLLIPAAPNERRKLAAELGAFSARLKARPAEEPAGPPARLAAALDSAKET